MFKILKSSAGYIYRPGTEYTCGDCVMLKGTDHGHGCAYFGPGSSVDAERGSCNYFAHGSGEEIPWLGIFTKEELGYLENSRGFSCKRCEHFAVLKEDCETVQKNSTGDTPGIISPNACCDFWEGDKKRARMTTAALNEMMARMSKSIGQVSGEEYRRMREKGEISGH